MKKNVDKGFMLAETLIVSSFIAIILIYLFVQFRNVNNNYSKTLKYNGVNEIYLLGEIKEYIETFDLEGLTYSMIKNANNYYVLNECDENFFENTSYCQDIFSSAGIVKAIYVNGSSIVNSENFSEGFNEFLETINNKDSAYLIAAEFEDGSYAKLKMNVFSFLTIGDLIKNQKIYTDVSSGAGLYYIGSNSDDSAYVFKSDDKTKLKNNVEVLGYKGRIISLDKKGLKVYLELKKDLIYDTSKCYFTSDDMIFKGRYFTNSSTNSSLYTVMNANLIENNLLANNATYGVGKIDNVIGNSLRNIISSENQTLYKINSKNYAATLTVSDIIRASLSSNCDLENISNDCLNDNWLNDNLWTMNYNKNSQVWNIYNNQFIASEVNSNLTRNAYMVVYLDSNISVIGDGTEESPYKFN